MRRGRTNGVPPAWQLSSCCHEPVEAAQDHGSLPQNCGMGRQLPDPRLSTQQPLLAFFFHFAVPHPLFHPYKLPQWSLVALKENSWLQAVAGGQNPHCCTWCSQAYPNKVLYPLLRNHSKFLSLKASPRHYSTQNPFISPETILTFSRDGVNISFLVKFSHGSSSRNSPQFKLATHSSDTVTWFMGQLLTDGFRVSS